MKSKIISFILVAVLLSGCLQSSPVQPPDFDTFIREVNDARKSNMAWTEDEKADLAAYTPDFADQMGAFTEEEMERLVTPPERLGVISLEEALKDVDTFFKLIQTTYGGYDYFGGDDVFLPIRDKIKAELETKSGLDAYTLEMLLSKYLTPVIVDGHFSIGSTSIISKHIQYMYYVPDLYFDDTTGLDMNYVKPTIGPDGRITYCFAALAYKKDDLPQTTKVNGKIIDLNWTWAQSYMAQDRIAYAKTEENGVPVFISHTLRKTTATAPKLDEMASSGQRYRGFPLFIIDIRDNNGGSAAYTINWIDGFAGTQQRTFGKHAFMQKISPLFITLIKSQGGNSTHNIKSYEPLSDNWIINKQDNPWIENDNVIIVLIDKLTVSAGEFFAGYLGSLDNIIFVGSNTYGCRMFGDICKFYLPNSGLPIIFGISLSFMETTENREGIGILPDLWVNPADSMDAVMRMIDYYDLPH